MRAERPALLEAGTQGGLEAALVLALAWFVVSLLRRSAPATRHHVWALGLGASLLVPVVSGALPGGWLSGSLGSGLWALGSCAGALRVSRGYLAAWRLSSSSEPVVGGPCQEALAEAARALGVYRVPLRISEQIGSPQVVGVLRPRILLPVEASGWDRERLRAILLHELGHVRRRDPLLQLLAQVATCAYWWNPLAWLAARRMRVEREHACDDLVLAAGVRPSSYAASLLAVAREVSARSQRADTLGAVHPSLTELRIYRILDPGAPRAVPSGPVRLGASGAALGLAVTLARAPALVEPAPESGCDTNQADAGRAVDLGGPLAIGERLPPELVAAEIRDSLPDLDSCPPGRVRFAVDLWGQAAEVSVLGDDASVACIHPQLAASTFPGLRGRTVEVSLPLWRPPEP